MLLRYLTPRIGLVLNIMGIIMFVGKFVTNDPVMELSGLMFRLGFYAFAGAIITNFIFPIGEENENDTGI